MRTACLLSSFMLASGCAGTEPGEGSPDAANDVASPSPDVGAEASRETAADTRNDTNDASAPEVCSGGTIDCDGDGTCENLNSNPDHCGRCGHSCLSGACLAQQCQPFPIATGMLFPLGVTVAGTSVYVTDFVSDPILPGSGDLVRIDADGRQTIIASGLSNPTSVWYDGTTDSLLIPSYASSIVMSVPAHGDAGHFTPDGGGVTTVVSNHLVAPLGLASNADWVFIGNNGGNFGDTDQVIQRRPRADLTQFTTFDRAPGRPEYLDLDANYLYWAEQDSGRIMRMRLGADPDAGASVAEVITSGLTHPTGIAVDGSNIYFSLAGTPHIDGGPVFGTIMRVDNQLGATAQLLVTLPGYVEDVAVDAVAIYVAGRGSGTVWKLAR